MPAIEDYPNKLEVWENYILFQLGPADITIKKKKKKTFYNTLEEISCSRCVTIGWPAFVDGGIKENPTNRR